MLKTSSIQTIKVTSKPKSRKDLEFLGSLFIGYLHEQSSYLMCLINDLILNAPTKISHKRAVKTAVYLEQTLRETRELINDAAVTRFKVNKEIRSCLKAVSYYKNKQKVKILYSSCKFVLNGHKNIFRQILICVLLNALEAFDNCQKNRIIEIKVNKHETKNSNSAKVSIEIIDNAGGIDEKVLKRIFKPKDSNKRDGTGLGLYFASKSINEFFNGNLILQTTKGKGTKLTLDFPV